MAHSNDKSSKEKVKLSKSYWIDDNGAKLIRLLFRNKNEKWNEEN